MIKNKFNICKDVIFTVRNKGVLASNHRARKHVWLNVHLFTALLGGETKKIFEAADLTRFSNIDGLLSDPTCLDYSPDFKTTKFKDSHDAFEYLHERFILIKDEASYYSYFDKKQSILDRNHFGTFHQQLGSELRIKLRTDPSIWWFEQKFDSKTGNVRDNLYKHIQDAFIQRYIPSLELEGKKVLDFGCGSGMASRLFANKGARVIGVDPDDNLLKKAQKDIGEKFFPVLFPLTDTDPLRSLPSDSIDMVWMSDVFMFYFYPQDAGKPHISPANLLSNLTANLISNGKCVIMQPHGVFWLLPWLGDEKRPYTIITEYSSRLYSVAPGLQQLCDVIHESKLAITKIYELTPDRATGSKDTRALAFASTFPLWWVFECSKIQG